MEDSVRRASVLLAIAGLSVFGALHGCGGGGGGGGDTNVPVTPAPTPAPSDEFLSVGLTSSDTSNNKTLLIVDADKPVPPRLAVNLSEALQNFPMTSNHATLDATTRTVTDRAAARVYFANSGGVFQVSLRKTDKTVAQRISSLTTACAVTAAYSLNFNDGPEDDLLEVSESGPDGNCAQGGDNRIVYVRTGAAIDQQATALPFGVKLISGLPSTTGTTTFLAGTSGTTPKLVLYSADLVYLGDVANSAGVATVVPAAAVPGSGMNALYVREGSGLRTLTWTASSASLSGSSYTYKSTTSTAGYSALADGTALYIMDGLELRRKVGGSSAAVLLGTLNASNGTQTALLGMSTDHVLIMQATSDGMHSAIYSLPKTGGAFVNLQALTNSFVNPLLGTYADEVVYATSSGIWRANADSSNKQVITDHGSTTKFGVGKIVKPWGTAGDIDAIVWCEIPGSSSYCVSGTLKSQDLATRTTTTLGTFSHTDALSWYASDYGKSLSGVPSVLLATASTSSSSTRKQDMYIAQPGKANSLVKISAQLH